MISCSRRRGGASKKFLLPMRVCRGRCWNCSRLEKRCDFILIFMAYLPTDSSFRTAHLSHSTQSTRRNSLELHDNKVRYTTDEGDEKEFDPLDFLALLTCHIPLVYESLVRFYGRWSCRSRGERAKKESANTDMPQADVGDNDADVPRRKASSFWAACIKRIYEIDPMECPKCHAQMRILSFIHDPPELKRIMDALGLQQFKAPKKLTSAYRASQEGFALHAA